MSTDAGARARQTSLEASDVPDLDAAPGASAERPLSGTSPEDPAISPTPSAPIRSVDGSDEFASGARVQAARNASAVDGLAPLLQAIAQASVRATGARDASARLLEELRALQDKVLEQSNAHEDHARALVAERDRLRAELEETQRAALAERAFLIDEQDRFLSGLLEEQEQMLRALEAERDTARALLARANGARSEPPPDDDSEVTAPGTSVGVLQRKLQEASLKIARQSEESERSRELLRRLQAQRDEAQEQVTRLTAERDKAQTELFTLRAERLSHQRTIPEPNPPSTFPPPAWQAQAIVAADDTEPRDRSPEPAAEPAVETHYPDLRSRPLKQKPSPTETPLGAYSMASEELPFDRLDVAEDKPDR
jgi:hypothetical protein